MLPPEFKAHLLLDGWTMEESTYFIVWQKGEISLQWDKGDTVGFEQMVFRSNKVIINNRNESATRGLSAYTSFQECIDDLE